jgi:flagellar biosynthetic protein FlhB
MAGGDKASKQLPPSARRLREARKKGQVPRSAELSAWAVVLVMSWAIGPLFHYAASQVAGLSQAAVGGFSEPTSQTALRLLSQGLYAVLATAGTASVVAATVAAGAQLAQSRPVLAWARLKPELARLSPAAGAKRLFSAKGAMNMGEQVAKLLTVSSIAGVLLVGLAPVTYLGAVAPVGALVSFVASGVLSLVRYVGFAGLVLGAADWWWRRRRLAQELKMTPEEAKQERRRDEGSPEARSARRRAALRLYRARMAGTVRGADVLVTNPTHFAIGLSYRAGQDRAPRVVAKGAGAVAARLRADALSLGVPVVEDAPLARSVFHACCVGDFVPVELYEAVAKLFAELYLVGRRLRDRAN